MKNQDAWPVAVIGAGPVGLAAAAQLLDRGQAVVVFEAGNTVAAHLETYRHVRLFSPWRYNVEATARRWLEGTGWRMPDEEALPTAGELIDHYLEPLSRWPLLARCIRYSSRVMGVSRWGVDKARTAGRQEAPFVLQVQGPRGVEEVQARAVIDASGTWGQPNPAGAHGLSASGERQAQASIAYGMPDILGRERSRYAGRHVAVVGAGHSAAGNLLALAALAELEPATRVTWLVRGQTLQRVFGGGARDGLPARGAIGQRLQALLKQGRVALHTGFAVRAIERGTDERLVVQAMDPAVAAVEGVDELVVATGARPDHTLSGELRTRFDPWLESTDALAPLIDPNEHSCGTVRPHGHRELAHAAEPGFYVIGAKSYGRAPNFLMLTGYEQARSVVAALAGDWAAADEVRLVLPETGVCTLEREPEAKVGACCGPAPRSGQQRVVARSCCA